MTKLCSPLNKLYFSMVLVLIIQQMPKVPGVLKTPQLFLRLCAEGVPASSHIPTSLFPAPDDLMLFSVGVKSLTPS